MCALKFREMLKIGDFDSLLTFLCIGFALAYYIKHISILMYLIIIYTGFSTYNHLYNFSNCRPTSSETVSLFLYYTLLHLYTKFHKRNSRHLNKSETTNISKWSYDPVIYLSHSRAD